MTTEQQKELELLEKLPRESVMNYFNDLFDYGIAIVENVGDNARLVDPFSEEGMDILEHRNQKP